MSLTSAFIHMELSQWGVFVEGNLSGKVIGSLDELKTLFPADERYSGAEFRKEVIPEQKFLSGYKLYSKVYLRDANDSFPVAYGCNNCEKIIVGPPQIKFVDDMNLEYRCVNCKCLIDTKCFGHICF